MQKEFFPGGEIAHVELISFACYRFYVENITQLKDIITIELFFLNAKSAVFNVSACLLVFSLSVSVMIHCL